MTIIKKKGLRELFYIILGIVTITEQIKGKEIKELKFKLLIIQQRGNEF